MRTTLDIDEKVLTTVIEITGEKNKGRAVNKALEEFIRRERIKDLLRLLETGMDIEPDWRKLRTGELGDER